MRERTRVEDITKLKTGDVILVNSVGFSAFMTVHIPFDGPKESRFAIEGPGVQCRVHPRGGAQGYDTLITEGTTATIFLLGPAAAQLAADIDSAVTELGNNLAAEEDLLKRIMEDEG